MRPVKKGSIDQSIVIRIIDSENGTPENGVVWNTAGIDLWYRREKETKTNITEATLATLDAAHSDGGFLFIGDGYYRLDLPDAAVTAGSGANGVMVGGTITDMIVIGCYISLVDYDPYDSVAMGLTNLDAAITSRQASGNVDLNADQSGVTIGACNTTDGKIDSMQINVTEILDYEAGNWKIVNNQMIFKTKLDAVLATYDLTKAGLPDSDSPDKREKV